MPIDKSWICKPRNTIELQASQVPQPLTSDSAALHTCVSENSKSSQPTQPHTTESVLPATFEFAPTQPTSESEFERVLPRKSRLSNHYWFVNATSKIFYFFFICNKLHCTWKNVFDFIDGEGVSQKLKVKVRDAHNLPNRLRVVVNCDDKFQPIG